jgi:hypothetical protein
MKKYIAMSFLLVLCGLSTVNLNSAPVTRSAAKECSDCGCKGPGGDGSCPKEKGKTCHCK